MKLITRLLGIISLLFGAVFCNAQQLQDGAWNTYYGKIGAGEAQLCVYKFKDNSVKGNYVFKRLGKKVTVQGLLKGNALLLTDAEDRSFKGNLFTDTVDKYNGEIVDSRTNQTLSFSFSLSTIAWGKYAHQYTDVFGTDDEIEQFMAKIKNAIVNDDKEWIASHLSYPFRFPPAFKSRRAYNKAEFLKYAGKVLTPALQNKVRDTYTTNLFVKNGEVMLGDGEVWITNTPNSTKSKYGFSVIAIN